MHQMRLLSKPVNSLEALKKLMYGNSRFINGLKSVEHIPTPTKLKSLSENGQKPFCIILGCSDSRVPSELVFDQGLGDLFVIRIAGNVVGPSLIASIEFAATNFGSCLLMVMGHTKCGAIHAAIDHTLNRKAAPSRNLDDLISRISPAVIQNMDHFILPEQMQKFTHACTWSNIHGSINRIQEESEIVRKLISEDKLMIVGSVFDLDSGKVILDENCSY